jgi:heterodisulfide reductase subunit A
MRRRIGVYICHCGSNISDYVDVEKVKDLVSKEENVVHVKTTIFACADSAQKEIVQDIKEKNLDGMVVASCSPKLHLYTFRNVAGRAGLNPYNYVQANIREQVSWAHSDKPEEATEKAVRIIKAAISRVRTSKALTPPRIFSENSVLVVGAGIAGMRAALELADMGSEVYLIEKDHYVGGRVSQWGEVYSSDESGQEIIRNLYDKIGKRENITLFTGAEIATTTGSVGNFEVTFQIRPRYLRPTKEIRNNEKFEKNLEKAIEVCPEKVSNDFDFGLTERKAIYKNNQGQFPQLPAIDDKICTKCNKCVEILPEIDLDQKTETLMINVGAIIISTGFDPYEPENDEFGYSRMENVITLQEFRRLIEINNSTELVYKNKKIKKISYIYCVGSRQIDGENKYCSRYCCTAAIHAAILTKKKFGDIENFHFHRGIRSYGKMEALYDESATNGDLYFQSSDDVLPSVEVEDGKTVVKINDILTLSREITVDTDLVVLVTGMIPRENKSLVNILKIPIGRDKFFHEVHPKLKPVEIVIDGIYIAGTCQSPKNITETVNSSLTAATKANSLISKGEIELEPTLAEIDGNTCKWCGKCEAVCCFNAIVKTKSAGKTIAAVNKANCKGCGICLPVCPVNAIDLIGFTDKEIEGMIDALAE